MGVNYWVNYYYSIFKTYDKNCASVVPCFYEHRRVNVLQFPCNALPYLRLYAYNGLANHCLSVSIGVDFGGQPGHSPLQ